MAKGMTIGAVARETGVPVRTIRFYESEGVLPAAARTGSGYRMYSESDVRRLRMVRDARLLGLALPDARALVERAFSSDCATFAPELRAVIAARKAEVGSRIKRLRSLQRDLEQLERHLEHAECAQTPGQAASECGFCAANDGEADDDGE